LLAPYEAGDFDSAKLGQFYFSTTDRYGKITEFDDLVRNDYGSVVDVAFFKFCYPDTDGTDYQAVFDSYANCLDALKVAYPNVTFVAFTGVLSDDEDISNIRRNQYNQLVRDRYQGVLPLFDVGDIESTKPTDETCTFEYGGETYRKMWPEYSLTDGFHPNAPEIEERLGKGLLVLLDKVLCSGSSAVEYWLLY